MSWQQFRMELDGGEVEPPTWDLAQVRAQGAVWLVSSLPEDDRFKPLAAKALADGRLARSIDELTDEELVALCDYRAASRRARRRGEPFLLQFTPRGPVVAECPRTPDTRGAQFDYFWRSRDQLFLRHLETVARRLPAARQPAVFVHGHTHLPDRGQEGGISLAAGHLTIPPQGFSPVRGAVTPVVINGGAWQRTITPVQFERIETERGLPRADLLRALQPEDLRAVLRLRPRGSVHRRAVAKRPGLAAVRGRRVGGLGRVRALERVIRGGGRLHSDLICTCPSTTFTVRHRLRGQGAASRSLRGAESRTLRPIGNRVAGPRGASVPHAFTNRSAAEFMQ